MAALDTTHLGAYPVVQDLGRVTRLAVPRNAVLHHGSVLLVQQQHTLQKARGVQESEQRSGVYDVRTREISLSLSLSLAKKKGLRAPLSGE